MKLIQLKTITLLSLLLIIEISWAQDDFNLAQYQNTPLLTNPANVGRINTINVFLNYRNQPNAGRENFQTVMLNAIYPLVNRYTARRYGGIGLGVVHDRPGSFLRNNGVVLAYAYNIPINHKPGNAHRHYVSLGAQAGYFLRSRDFEGLNTEQQFVNGVLDPTLPSGEEMADNTNSYFTATSGVMWHMEDTLGKSIAHFGVSMFNMNQPDNSFFNESTSRLPSYFVSTGGVRVFHNRVLSITPTFRWVNRSGNNQINMGAIGKYRLFKNIEDGYFKEATASLGVWYNLNQAFVATAQLDMPKYMVAFNFDLPTTQDSRNWQGNSVFEITVGVKMYPKLKSFEPYDLDPIDDFDIDPNDSVVNYLDLAVVDLPPKPKPKTAPGEEDGAFRFEKGSSELTERSKALLDSVALVLMEHPDATITITGHTCDLGGANENMELSKNRAYAMLDYIMNYDGIDPNRIDVDWKGETKPLVPNIDEPHRVQNRRVAFKIKYPG